MIHTKPVIVIVGPTAVGKSSVAIRLAQDQRTEIISADSRQIYRGMDIGTAKPSPKERTRITHHLIDIVDPNETFSAGRFKTMAVSAIAGLHRLGRIPIVVGGTGLYIKSLIYGLWRGPEANWELRERLREKEALHGPGYLHHMLSSIDSKSADRIQHQDVNKLIRAIEIFEQTGCPVSTFHHRHQFKERPYQAIVIGLRRSRPDLYQRIDQRVENMMTEGLLEETRGLLKRGYAPDLPSMKGLGYSQIAAYLAGAYSLCEAVRRFKRDTRRYAKRQFTWFNKDSAVQWIDLSPSDGIHEAYSKVQAAIQSQEEAIYANG